LNFGDRGFFVFNGPLNRRVRERKVQFWIGYPRPIKLWKVHDLIRQRICQRERVAGSSVKGLFKVKNLSAKLPASGLNIFSNLPIHSDLQRIFNSECAALDKKEAVEVRRAV